MAERIRLEITGDSGDLVRACAAATGAIRGVNAETRRADAASAGMARSHDRTRGAVVGLRRSSEGLHGSLLRLRLGLGALAVIPAAQGFSAAAAGAVALTGALGPLAGGLAAIPGVAAGAATAIASVQLATGGLADAVKSSQARSAQDAASALQDQSASAEQARQAALGLSAAEREERFAQEDLTQARKDATRELQDLRDAAEGAETSQKGAVLALRRARAELNRTYRDPGASGLDIDEARLSVERAQDDVERARREGRRARADYADARRQGVDQMPQVVDAERAVADAHRATTEAAHQVRQASEGAAAAIGKQSTAAAKLARDMAGLPPAGREFVRFLVGLKPKLDELRATAADGLLPGAEEGLRSLLANFGPVDRAIAATSDALGDVAAAAGRQLGSQAWGADIETLGSANADSIERLGGALLDVVDGLRHTAIAAIPFNRWLTDTAVGWAHQGEAAAEAGRRTGDTARFLDRTRAVLERLGSITQSVTDGLLAVGRAGTPLGDDMWRSIDRVAQRFEDWSESARGQNALAHWFERARQVGHTVIGALDDMIRRFRHLRREGRSSFDALAISVSEGLGRALEHAARTMAERAPAIAEAFVRGFYAAGIWGRLLVGTWLLRRMGGLGAFRAIGAKSGAAMRAGLMSFMRANGPAIAASMALILGPELEKSMRGLRDSGVFDPTTGEGSEDEPGYFRQATDLVGLTEKQKPEWTPSDAIHDFRILMKEARQAGTSVADLRERLDEYDKTQLSGAQRRELFRTKLAAVQLRYGFDDLRDGSVKSVEGMERKVAAHFRLIARVMGNNSKEGREAVRTNFDLAARNISRFMRDGTLSTKGAMEEIRKLMVSQSGIGRQSVFKNFKQVEAVIGGSMTNSKGITRQGMDAIRLIMVNEMENLGLSQSDIRMSLNKKASARKGFTQPGARGGLVQDIASGVRNYAAGGLVQFGRAGEVGTDSIPVDFGGRKIVVAPGEQGVVFNRHQLPVLNARLSDMGGLPGFFKRYDRPHHHHMAKGGLVGGFAGGGMVRVPGDPDTTGGRDLVNPAIASKVAAWIRKFHTQIGYAYDPGGGHQSAGHNVTGTATDVVPGPGGSWDTLEAGLKAFIRSNPDNPVYYGTNGIGTPLANHGRGNHAHIEWGGAGPVAGAGVAAAGVAARIARMSIEGPGGALQDSAQRALDVYRHGAQTKLDKAARAVGASSGTAGPHGVPGGSYTGPLDRDFGQGSGTTIGFNQAAMLAEKAGLPGITYAQIARGESGLRPGAVSADGGYGLWQMTPRVQSAATVAAWKRIGSYFNPWNNARMAKVLAGSGTGVSNYYGTGFVTDPNKHYTGPVRGLAAGGLVGAVGDSLGVGTFGHLKGMLGGRLRSDAVSGRSSADGIGALRGMLGDRFDRYVVDLGTNDPTGGALAASVRAADRMTGKRPIVVPTVNGPAATAKNAALRALAGGDISLVGWASNDRGLVGPDGIHATSEAAYGRRAAMIAGALRKVAGRDQTGADLDTGPGPGGKGGKGGKGRVAGGPGVPTPADIRAAGGDVRRAKGALGDERAEARAGKGERGEVSDEEAEEIAKRRRALREAKRRLDQLRKRRKVGGRAWAKLRDTDWPTGLVEAFERDAGKVFEDRETFYGFLRDGYSTPQSEGGTDLAPAEIGQLLNRPDIGRVAQLRFAEGLRERAAGTVRPAMGAAVGKVARLAKGYAKHATENMAALGPLDRQERSVQASLDELKGVKGRDAEAKRHRLRGALTDVRRRQDPLEWSNRLLTGRDRPRELDSGKVRGGLLGKAFGQEGRFRESLAAFTDERLRPSGLAALAHGIRMEIADLQGTELAAGAGGDNGLADMLRQDLDITRRALRVSEAQFGTLRDFRGQFGDELVGRFAHGTVRVPRSGMAYVHRDEVITPDPQGPYGNQLAPAGGGGGGSGGPSSVELTVNVRTDAGQQVEIIDARIDGKLTQFNRGTGQRSRAIAAAPGGRRGSW